MYFFQVNFYEYHANGHKKFIPIVYLKFKNTIGINFFLS